MDSKMIDNVEYTLKEELDDVIKRGSKVSIIAASFSMYAYEALKKNLNNIDELKFIFTSPTFVSDKVSDEKREFFIPKRDRERSLYGTEFEVRLRNELTQKAISKECADWIAKKVKFKTNTTNKRMQGYICVENNDEKYAYNPITDFTTDGIGCGHSNDVYSFINKIDDFFAEPYKQKFNELWNDKNLLKDVTEEVLNKINAVYKENPADSYIILPFTTFLRTILMK